MVKLDIIVDVKLVGEYMTEYLHSSKVLPCQLLNICIGKNINFTMKKSGGHCLHLVIQLN